MSETPSNKPAPVPPLSPEIEQLREQLKSNTDLISRMQQAITMLQSMVRQPFYPQYQPGMQTMPGMTPQSYPMPPMLARMPYQRGSYEQMQRYLAMQLQQRWMQQMGVFPQQHMQRYQYQPMRSRGRGMRAPSRLPGPSRMPGQEPQYDVDRPRYPAPEQRDVERAQNIEGRYAKLRKDLGQRSDVEWKKVCDENNFTHMRDASHATRILFLENALKDPVTAEKVRGGLQIELWLRGLEESYARVVRSIESDTNSLAQFRTDGSGKVYEFISHIRGNRDRFLSRLDEVVTSYEERVNPSTKGEGRQSPTK